MGLGSSASFAACFSSSLYMYMRNYYKIKDDNFDFKKKVNELTFKIE